MKHVLVLIGRFDQSQTFDQDWPEPYMSLIGPKQEENVVFKSWEKYYIVCIYNFY